MPFITADFDNRLVDDDEYVQKYKDYCIARKLYVWLDAPFPDDDVSLFFSSRKIPKMKYLISFLSICIADLRSTAT